MLTLPEHLLLIALHDHKGTVHPAAFLALDPCLHGAVLAELRLQGRVQTSSTGEIRRTEDAFEPTGFPVLDDAMPILAELPSPAPTVTWLEALDKGLPDIRAQIILLLQRRGILEAEDVERSLLGESKVHPMRDDSQEVAMRARLSDTVRGEPGHTSPRLGCLLALADAANLLGAAFDAEDRDAAAARSQWVFERDAVVRAVREEVSKTEGTWS